MFWVAEKMSLSFSRGQKCCHLFHIFSVVLVKLATSSLPPQTKLNFEQMGGMTAFSAHNIAGGGVEGRQDEPKEDKKNCH